MNKKQLIVAWMIGMLLLSGCASGGLPPTRDLIQITNKDAQAMKTFNYPYKEVFYASEDAMLNCSAHPYLVRESSLEGGYILATRRGDPVMCGSVMAIVEKIEDNQTRIKMRGFRDIRWQAFYNQFFKRVEMNLRRMKK
jgi:hypothetical protein